MIIVNLLISLGLLLATSAQILHSYRQSAFHLRNQIKLEQNLLWLTGIKKTICSNPDSLTLSFSKDDLLLSCTQRTENLEQKNMFRTWHCVANIKLIDNETTNVVCPRW